ncbi:unnamed protein product [Fraxinus pennsylvanica]|uniref:peroxidase n=1 Tax=Fraxinus pennsylvanica TaxID=56036 RepID=A0AAD2E3P1_9LAMI|nr:unnamed protein product [Fraxinus pennsylvanica]
MLLQHYPVKPAQMAMSYMFALILAMDTIASGLRFGVEGLSMNYYIMNCPFAEGIIKNTVNMALQSDPTLAAGLVRMHFHDCFVEGCDGSVLIDSTKGNTAEKDSPANLSLRGYEIIDQAKEEIEKQCPGVVSCADILAMAARDAVFFAGGPVYDIPKGRKDGRRSKIEDTINLPPPTLNSSGLIRMFGQRGFTAQEMVALSGAHTLGVARCSSFKHRLSNFDTTNDVDPTLDTKFAKTLSKTCRAGDNAEQAFDSTRNSFDNDYFYALQRKNGVLFSDQTLFASARTRGIVNGYAMNQAMFFLDFQQAMVKMSMLDVKEGSKGEGCDGSVLIDSTKGNTAEKDSPANLSLRGYEIIDQAKEEIEKQCPGVVSCADILAMAARDAVFFAGGPVYDIPKGRKDGRRSKIEDTINLPPPTLNSSGLIRMFGQRGFTAQEMVALSGAHTLGVARCSSFKHRLSNFDTTNDVDPTLDTKFAKTLSKTCRAGDNAEQAFDSTRNSFDNDYFYALQRKNGVLFSDQTLFASARTRGIVNGYAMNQAMFFLDFQQAMVKMSMLDVKEGSKGEVRDNCRLIN